MPKTSGEFSSLGKLSPKRKLALSGFLFFLLFIGFIMGILLSRGTLTLRLRARETPQTPATIPLKTSASLAVSPAQATIAVGEEIPLTVISTGDPVTQADVTVTFDPNVFTASNVELISPFSQTTRESTVDNQNGLVIVSTKVGIGSQAATGPIFSFRLQAKSAAQNSPVTIDIGGNNAQGRKTALGRDGTNILQLAIGGNYTVSP